jgi:putative protease
MSFEILAPAGSRESLIAGVRSGANAVYLGGKLFNARRNAGNFSDEELAEAVGYCHQRNVKVYLTFNILASDEEMQSAYSAVATAMQAGVDAFIVQDIGLAKMIREHFPEARLHASTQMSVMTVQGVKALESMGFSRVVLPRELTLEDIEDIRANTTAELELFVHGALCMSVSGQCYLSSMLGSRSGNRGLCAQPCRLPFTAGGNATHALSLKDLSLIKRLGELDGITSLKIEGRMKRPEYVAAAVNAVRKAIDGTLTPDDENTLRSVFSRSGFTDGYLTGRRTPDMFGTRQKEDVVSAVGVLKEISRGYDNENPLIKTELTFVCREGEPAVLTAQALGKTVTVTGDIPEKALNKPMTEESVSQRLAKLGGTQYYAEKIKIELDGGLIMPAAKINEMRRQAVEELDRREPAEFTAKPLEIITPAEKNAKPYLTAVFRSAEQLPERHPFERVFIPPDSSLEDFIDNRAGVVLPRGLFGVEEALRQRLEKLKKAGVKKALCGNLGSYALARELGFEVYGDFGLNIFNSEAANQISSPLLSFELTLAQANRINAENTGLAVYGRMPLMLTRNCPVKNDVGCAACGRNGALTDRKGVRFPVICSDYPCAELLNSVPLYMLDRLDEIRTDYAQLYFYTESKKEVEEIIALAESGVTPEFRYTRGLYYRGAV